MSEPILDIKNLGVSFGEKIVLNDVTLSVPDTGIVVLFGPSGSGKSTLLRSICGVNDANPSYRMWGKIRYLGEKLGKHEYPALVSQSAKLMISTVFENIVYGLPERNNLTPAQQKDLVLRLLDDAGLPDLKDKLDMAVVELPLAVQRHLAILRVAVSRPKLIFIDEPTSGLKDDEIGPMLEYIDKESKRCAILVVLHNQQQAKQLGGYAALLAGGSIQEFQDSNGFFTAPKSPVAEQFTKHGSCTVATPGADPRTLDESVAKPAPLSEGARKAKRRAKKNVKNASFGPRGFLWLRRGQLAGTPLPGVFHDINYDLKALHRVGVNTLITTTKRQLDDDELAKHKLRAIWSYIEDMGAPTFDQAVDICQKIDEALDNGEVVAAHCRAGLGRTGTVLAMYLIWEGSGALEALETVRAVEPRWVQSDVQVSFLEEFAKELAKGTHDQRSAVS